MKSKFWLKVLLPAAISLVVFSIAIITFANTFQTRNATAAEDEKLTSAYSGFQANIDALSEQALLLALEIANQPIAQEAMANRDRETIIAEYLESYLAIDSEFGVPQSQFHLPPAISFVRLHDIEAWGDDLSSFRFTVLDVNATEEPKSGIEVGRGGIGIRGVAPVFYEGEHVGSFEVGLNLDRNTLEVLKSIHGGDWYIYLNKNSASIATLEGFRLETPGPIESLVSVANTLEGEGEQFLPIAPATYPSVLDNNEAVIERVQEENAYYAVLSAPLYDYQHNNIGMIQIAFDRSGVIASGRQVRAATVALTLGATLALTIAIYLATQATLRPLLRLTDTAQVIARGNFDIDIPVTTRDEIGELADSFRVMVGEIKQSFQLLEDRVEERTRALQTATDVGAQITTILDVDRLLQDVVDLTKERFNLYHAHLYLLNEQEDTLILTSGAGHVGRQMVAETRTIDLYNRQSIVAQSARGRNSVVINDVHASKTFLPHPLLPDTQAELATPLMARGQLLGVLDVQSDQIDFFNDETRGVLELLASQIATALSNAQLFEAVERTSRHEQAMSKISRRIQEAVDLDDLLQVTVRELGKALRVPYTAIELKVNEGNGAHAKTDDGSAEQTEETYETPGKPA